VARFVHFRACLAATFASLAFAGFAGVEPAGAQSLDPVDLSGPLDAVEETQNVVEETAADTLALVPSSNPPADDPPPGGGGTGSPSDPPAPPSDPPGGGDPAPTPPPDGTSTGEGGGSPDPVAGGAGPSRNSPQDAERRRGDSAGSGRGRETRRQPEARAEAKPAAAPDEPTTLERIVAVVPTELKLALALLALLAAGSLLSARRTRGKLAQAEQRAATDSLTDLPNRISAEQALERLVAQGRRQGKPVSVALFDLDHFKVVNDSFGHAAGDEALCQVAHAARAILRGSDHVARFGGEEFLLILPDTDREGAITAAETLRKAIASLEIEGPGSITASFGVATMPADALDPPGLLAAADAALYAAKDRGRDRVEAASKPEPVLEPAA